LDLKGEQENVRRKGRMNTYCEIHDHAYRATVETGNYVSVLRAIAFGTLFSTS